MAEMMTEKPLATGVKEIVVLGGSFAGLSIAHYLLKHVIPAVPESQSYHVTLVSTSSHFMGRIASPRAVTSEKLMPDEKVFLPIDTAFKQYGNKMTFIHGTATDMDPTARTVTINTPAGASETIAYYSLVLATGTKTHSPLLGLITDHHVVKESWVKFRAALPTAKSIVIAGGGPAGVETAGELGEYLNGKAGMFESELKNPKVAITVVTSDKKILPALRPAIALKAEKLLAKVGVNVIKEARVESVTPSEAGAQTSSLDDVIANATIHLSNGTTMDADLYIPATGVKPNTEFVPKNLLTDRGYVETDPKTLRVTAAGPRVYALGDVGSYTRGGVMDIYDAVPVLATNIKRDLRFAEGQATGEDRPYKPNLTETQIVPIGQSKGVGAIFGWKLPSFFVWAIKGRDYFAGMSPDMVNGNKWKKESKWKLDA